MLSGLGSSGRGPLATGLALVIAAPGLALLLAGRPAAGVYAGAWSNAPYPAGTLVQPPRPLPAMALLDEHGRATSLSRFHGRWLVLAPAMTLCREACPLTTAVLDTLNRALRRDGLAGRVSVAEATVDPWRDTPARLRAYRRLTHASFGLLGGTAAEMRRLWGVLGVFYERVPEGSPAAIDWMTHRRETFDVQHTDGVFILDPEGRERVVEEGIAAPGAALPPALLGLLDAEGRHDLLDPQQSWTAGQLLADLSRLTGIGIRGAQTAATRPPSEPAPRPPRNPAAPAPAPALHALAAISAQGGRLLGGIGALRRRVAGLRGLPVVLNVWASWCPPCSAELPIFAATARVLGNQAAFLGIDVDDTADAARNMLASAHLPYPSYAAAIGELASLAPVAETPSTIMLDRAGQVVYVHPGEYPSSAALEADVRRYAFGQP